MSTAYFSIIQYSERPESSEFVNVGVALFHAELAKVQMQFAEGPERIKRMFDTDLSKREFRFIVSSFESRLQSEFTHKVSRDSIDYFVRMRSGKLRMTPPRSLLSESATSTLSELFADYVGAWQPKRTSGGKRPKTRLREELSRLQVINQLIEPQPVKIFGGILFEAPYAYQNGSLNLLQPVKIKSDLEDAVKSVSYFAINGQRLYSQTAEQKRLVLIADFESNLDDDGKAIRDIMTSHSCGYYSLQNLKPLADEIRRSAAH